jgi:hypothetical protein
LTPRSGPLSVSVNEPSEGLFYWSVTQLSDKEHSGDLCIDASDHPYPTHEAARSAGAACLKVRKTS